MRPRRGARTRLATEAAAVAQLRPPRRHRERDVLRLATDGLPNGEIAARLLLPRHRTRQHDHRSAPGAIGAAVRYLPTNKRLAARDPALAADVVELRC